MMERAIYHAEKIAAEVVDYCVRHDYNLTNQKLQLVLYFLQARFLVDFNRGCFYQDIEAWDSGPVVPEVYNAYRFFGANDIPCSLLTDRCYKQPSVEDDRVICEMIERCCRYSESDLSRIVHRQDPWEYAYKENQHNIISNRCMKRFFRTT